jgi:type I restriction enzyme R subunit
MRAVSSLLVVRRPSAAPGPTPATILLVPFVFSANGRPYLKQLETQSGIWFRDARKPTNHRRALTQRRWRL